MYRVFNGNKRKLYTGIIIGLVATLALFLVIVGIGCAVNGLTFSQQIVSWFGGKATEATEVAETVETAARIML